MTTARAGSLPVSASYVLHSVICLVIMFGFGLLETRSPR